MRTVMDKLWENRLVIMAWLTLIIGWGYILTFLWIYGGKGLFK